MLTSLANYGLPHGGTIPPQLYVTDKKPDIVMIDEKSGDFELFELTCCADRESNINAAQSRKSIRYRELVRGIDSMTEFTCKLSCFEVCSLGNIPSHTRQTIRYLVGNKVARQTFKTLTKLAIATSYYTFNRRRDKDWVSPPLFERRVVDSNGVE